MKCNVYYLKNVYLVVILQMYELIILLYNLSPSGMQQL